MIIETHPYNGREDRIKHASDAGVYIEQEQTGRRYVEAVDVYPSRYTYVETDEPIEPPEPPEEEEEEND